jgi:hypothetical protein
LSCLNLTRGATLTQALSGICSTCCTTVNDLITTKISLTSEQILNLHTTPLELLPAPGVNKIILIFNIVSNYIYNITAYTGNRFIQIYYGSPSFTVFFDGSILFNTSSSITLNNLTNNYIEINSPININVATGNPANGDGTLDLYISYKIINL